MLREKSCGIPFDGSMLLLERSSGNVGVQLMLGREEEQATKDALQKSREF